MEILIIILAIILVLQIIILIKGQNAKIQDLKQPLSDAAEQITKTTQTSVKTMGELISTNQKNADDKMQKALSESFNRMEVRLKTYESMNEQKLEKIRDTVEKKLTEISDKNEQKLDQMRKTVDEKLQKSLEEKMNQSFKLVSERLEQVYRGLGEMQSLATGVGDLKKVLSNVKTRGILGEIQLGAILKEILSPEQYEENIATVPNSKNVVEFAVKMPSGDGGFIYLPIDSKFPQDAYLNLKDAYDTQDAETIQKAMQTLVARIKSFAKDIHTKYVEVPYTTDFAIMFLPFEGLYAEVINCSGLVEFLQREYHINVTGPSTMAALLNSIQMGFKTLAIQKRSQEVWNILGAVKSEFDKFEKVIQQAQQRINQANKELDALVGVRTRAIQRTLRSVENIESQEEINFIEE